MGWWDGKLVTDKIKLGAMAAVTAGFTMITRAEQFYIAGADWVGIMGMAYESIAAVSIICSVEVELLHVFTTALLLEFKAAKP